MLKPHQKIPEMPLIPNLAPQRIFIKQEILDREYDSLGSPRLSPKRQTLPSDYPREESPYHSPIALNTHKMDYQHTVHSPHGDHERRSPENGYESPTESRITIIEETRRIFEPTNNNSPSLENEHHQTDIDVENSEDNDSPLDLRVNFDRDNCPNRDRDSGTESDDTEDKLMIQDDADCKPYKKNLIKRCKWNFRFISCLHGYF